MGYMARNTDITTAAQFENLDERAQGDLEHDAWSQVAEQFATEHSDLHDLLDKHDAWDDMQLEIYEDEHGRKYFHKVTGVQYAPGHENGKRLSEAAHEFLNEYRDRLSELVRDYNE